VQILGGENVKRVTLGVSCNADFLEEAVKAGSNFCIFHHGLDMKTYKSRVPKYTQERLKIIIKNQLTIAGFHYSLDAHPNIGNNATIIKLLGAKIKQPFFEEWGYTAEFNKPMNVKELANKCSKLMEHEVFAVYTGPKSVKTIAVVSGAGKPYAAELAEMEAKGVELYISGETTESLPNKMKEAGINYFACGHYATEVFGVQELGKVIKSHFKDKLEVEFIEIPNPI
jgi:dinuclear metal center YbgI/SA1388 family protein